MPGRDGTGPKGRGPMTGRAGGYCMLKLPGSSDEPICGFAGHSGYAVKLSPDDVPRDLASLRQRAQSLEVGLRDMRRRIAALVADRSPS